MLIPASQAGLRTNLLCLTACALLPIVTVGCALESEDDEEMGLSTGAALAATTYYVRTDGGDANQCTGLADAPYPGTGTGRPCAWKSLHYALPASGAPRIAGGDTVIVGPGSYMIGVNAPGANGGRCGTSTTYKIN